MPVRKTTIVFLFIFFGMLCQAAEANELCEFAFEKLAAKGLSNPWDDKAQARAGKWVAKFALQFANRLAKKHTEPKVRLGPSDDRSYLRVLRTPKENETLHSIDGPRYENTDYQFILHLPTSEDTPWERLNSTGRAALIEELEMTLRKGSYDNLNLGGDAEGDLFLPINQVERIQALHRLNGATLPLAIDPLLLLRQANRGEYAGQCRHGNCALVGIAAMLGAKRDDLQLQTGGTLTRRKERHIWFESKDLVFGDATPGDSKDRPLLKKHRALDLMIYQKLLYPVELTTHPEFFDPINLDLLTAPVTVEDLRKLDIGDIEWLTEDELNSILDD